MPKPTDRQVGRTAGFGSTDLSVCPIFHKKSPLLYAIKRMAFLLPPEIIASMSIEQTMETKSGLKFVQKYFDTEKDAKEWLMEK